MSNQQNRKRMTLQEATTPDNYKTPMIVHLVDNMDGTYSLMYHINCEWCDYCEVQGDARAILDGETITPVPFKVNPYELQNSGLPVTAKIQPMNATEKRVM